MVGRGFGDVHERVEARVPIPRVGFECLAVLEHVSFTLIVMLGGRRGMPMRRPKRQV